MLPLLRLALFASVAISLPVALPSPVRSETALDVAEVPFLTLRNRTGSGDPAKAFGDDRGTLSAGVCRVRAVDLQAFAPLARSMPAAMREALLRVEAVEAREPADLLAGAPVDGGASAGGPGVLYVHGYNIGFAKGCRRAALLRRNASLEDGFLWFSWPSDGAVASYPRDESNLYWSVPDLAETILDLESRDGERIDLVGHSLGARGVVLALYEVANRRPEARLGRVVLLAPDIDFAIFQRLLPRIAPIASSLTIYVAEKDRPLALSAQLHGYARLGQAANDVTALDGVEVVDASDVTSEDLTGHLYHIFSPEVGADLDGLLNHRRRAGERAHLSQTGPNRWRIIPGAARISE